MTTDRDDIASCPFCGGEAKLRRLVEKYPAEGEHPAGEYDAWFYVNCDDCGIEVGDEYESGAIEAWNRRAPSASMGRVTAATALADWLGYSWDGLPDRGSDGFPDWAYDGTGRKRYQGGKDGLLRLVAALDSPPDHGGGEGWVMVPREPTMAMMAAGANRVDDSMAHANAVYRAMLTSLPTQESEDGR